MSRRSLGLIIGVVALGAGGLGAGLALTSDGTSSHGTVPSATSRGSSYSYYRSMMGSFGRSSMMGGGSYSWMMGTTGYRWMMGDADAAPAWMRGSSLPGFMMGTSTDLGKIMGQLFADAPGPRVGSTDAARLGDEVPAGATVDRQDHRITFSGATDRLTVLAGPSGGPDETFRVAGMVNPTIAVRSGARIRIEVVNADLDTAHGLVIAASGSASSWMPMMTTTPAFTGSALWFLGSPTSEGMHVGTLSFTATTPGQYQYLCAVPGHARKGMVGTFVVSS